MVCSSLESVGDSGKRQYSPKLEQHDILEGRLGTKEKKKKEQKRKKVYSPWDYAWAGWVVGEKKSQTF